jgi:glycine/D-amino acid oxidase-like deaminating enzyme
VRVVVVGAGINGVTAAIELRRRGHEVTLTDAGPLPHPLAASTDISKVVRAAYGPDEFYTDLADRATRSWREWNIDFGEQLYHETGVLFLKRGELRPGDYEFECVELLKSRGHKLQLIDSHELRARFPAWNADHDWHGFFDPQGGYAESSRVVAALLERAKSLGVQLRLRKTARIERSGDKELDWFNQSSSFHDCGAGDRVIFATGAWTPFLLPFTATFFRARGQPVFHFRPQQPELFEAERFPVFGADLSTSGYYGFPLNRDGVVKIGNHGAGRAMSPDSAQRAVTAEEVARVREFVARTFPPLANAPIVHTRLCMYCDTADGDFWIASDPERPWLVIAAGDNGHGFKFAPVLGEIIADAAEGKPSPLLERFRWRPEVPFGATKEAARPTDY